MKIVCDSCSTKYSIADEKVNGKVFKIRCKKCSNVIVVKGNVSGETAAASADGAMGAAAGAAEWYVVIDGEQVGPITVQEVESYFMSGRIAADTYGWRDGMGDWQHVADIPEFAHLSGDVAGPNEATQIADSSGYGGYEGGGGYDDGGVDATNVMQSPLGAQESDSTMSDSPGAMGYGDPYPSDPGYGESYGFGGEESEENSGYGGSFGGYGGGMGGELAAAGGDEDDGGAGMFAAFDGGADSDFMSFGTDSAPASNNGTNGSHGSNGGAALANNMVGQRNENSVLFSLSSLDNVAASGGGGGGLSGGSSHAEDVPLTEGSGLIDIQALATAHKSMSSGGDAAGGDNIDPFAQGTMAMPALMPMGSHRSNKGLIAAAVGGGVLLLTLIVVLLVTVLGKDEAPQQPQIVEKVIVQEKFIERPVDENAAKEAEAAEKAALAAAAADPAPSDEEGAVAAPEADDKEPSKSRRTTQRSRKDNDDKPEPEPEKAAPSKPKGDGIDRLLGELDEKKSEAPQKRASTSKKSLSRADVKNTIGRYQGRIATCAKSHNSAGKKGTVKVKFAIQPSGRVRGERIVSSGFKGTDVGNCVEKVVGQMKFPETSASKDVPVTYPFILN
mgnify:FL=1